MIPRVVDFFDALIPRAAGSSTLTLRDPNQWDEIFGEGGSRKSDAGINIGVEEALRFGPVVQCLEIKSGDIGVSTMHIHKEQVDPGESDIDYAQSAERVCSLEWNEYMPANEGWQNLVFHNQLWGDGYAYIARQGGSPSGPIQWMANLPPTSVEPYTDEHGNLMYFYRPGGVAEPQHLFPWEVFHLRSLAINNHRSLRLLSLMRNELGLALASKLFLSKFFQRGGHHGGILQIPPGTSAASRENLEKGVEKRASPDNWFKTLILRDGATWQSSTIDPRTAQMHELSDDEARAVCHFFNVPPWKLGIRDSESYNSAEQAAKAYITGTLQHICTRIAGEAMMKLVTERTRRARSHRFEHNFSKLVQSDFKSMNEVLEIQRRNEIISANDWRKKINLPERADDKANEYYNPNTKSNLSPEQTSAAAGGDSSGNPPDQTQNTPARQNALTAMVNGAMTRAAKRLTTVCRNKARKPNDLLAWCDSKAADHAEIVTEELTVPLQCVIPQDRVDTVLMATEKWVLSAVTRGAGEYLEPPHKPADLVANIETFCGQFMETVCDNWHMELLDANI